MVLANPWALSPPQIATKIMLPNEVFALQCRKFYEEQGLTVDETNGEFAHSPYPEGMGSTGYYLLHDHHQQQGLLQSRDVGRCCFFIGHAKRWLEQCEKMPEGYFDLWDIYDTYKGDNGRKVSSQFKEKGEGIFNPKFEDKIQEARKKSGEDALRNKTGIFDPTNKPLVLKASRYALENQVGIYDPKHKTVVQETRKKNGKSAVENKSGIFNPDYAEKHKEVGRKVMSSLHSEKDESGKSVMAIRNARNLHSLKDENGRSVVAMKASSQVWESLIDGYRSTASGVSRHNTKNGWDPAARVRIE